MYCGEGNQKIFRIKFAAGAEAAAHLRFDEMNVTLRHARKLRQDTPVGVGHLCRAPHGQKTPAFIILGHEPACFHRHCRVALRGEFLFNDQIGVRHDCIDVADIHLKIGGDIVSRGIVKLRFSRPHSVARLRHYAQRLVLHVDQFEGIFRNVAAFRDDDGDRLSDVPDFVDGDRCLQGPFETGYAAGSHRNGF